MDSLLSQSLASESSDTRPDPLASGSDQLTLRLGRMLLGLAATTWLLMGLGSATRVMNAGLSCPDWPLCYGELVPSQQMNLQVFLEWFHRMVASGVGLATLLLMGFAWLKRKALPPWLPWGLSFAVGLVLVQGILGGLTVTELLRFDIVTAHLGTGLLFFATVLSLGLLALPRPTSSDKAGFSVGSLPWLGLGAVLLVYGQSILGALVASQWALHQCFASGDLCWVMNSHLVGVAPATIAVLAVAVGTGLMRKRIPKILRVFGHSTTMLLIAQVVIGVLTYRFRLQVEPLTVAHQMIGAALLGSLLGFTVLAWQVQQSSPVSRGLKRVAVTAEITSE